MDKRILTLHPQGKQGVNISQAKYDQVRQTLLGLLRRHKTMTFAELTQAAAQALRGKFDGSVSWYVTTVKLDLEARGEIERVAGAGPQQLRLKR